MTSHLRFPLSPVSPLATVAACQSMHFHSRREFRTFIRRIMEIKISIVESTTTMAMSTITTANATMNYIKNQKNRRRVHFPYHFFHNENNFRVIFSLAHSHI